MPFSWPDSPAPVAADQVTTRIRSAMCASSSASRRKRFGTIYLYLSGTIKLYYFEGVYGNGDQCQ